MNSAQQRKYRWEWGQVRQHLITKGMTPAKADAERAALHRKALGHDKSSKKFTNKDLDQVISAFRAVWDDANFSAQMRQQEQPAARALRVLDRIDVLLPSVVSKTGLERRYLGGLSEKIFGTNQPQNLSDVQLLKLEGILIRHIRRHCDKATADEIIARSHEAARARPAIAQPDRYVPPANEEEEPF